MADLVRAVTDFVRSALADEDALQVRADAEAVIGAIDGAKPDALRAGAKALSRAIPKGKGLSGQLLCLALGALVESGAPPEDAWPGVSDGLAEMVARAVDFSEECQAQSEFETPESAVKRYGDLIAKKRPANAAAWEAVPARVLAAVACLSRSKKLRAAAAKIKGLYDSAEALRDCLPKCADLFRILALIEEGEIVVASPLDKRGWRIKFGQCVTVAELQMLIADAVLGGSRSAPVPGRMPGKRPPAKVLRHLVEGEEPIDVAAPFHLVAWTALSQDGGFNQYAPLQVMVPEWLPIDLPFVDEERMSLIHPPFEGVDTILEGGFGTLAPFAKVVRELSAADVNRYLTRWTKEAELHGPRPSPPQPPEPKPKKKVASKKAASPKAKAKTAAKKAKAPPTTTTKPTAKKATRATRTKAAKKRSRS